MRRSTPVRAFPLLSLLVAMTLTACGGSSGGNSGGDRPVETTAPAPGDVAAPLATGNTATDGFAWFNYRRSQVGVPPLSRNTAIDTAAQSHSDYQKLNNTITHEQLAGKPGFTGVSTGERLVAAGYVLPSSGYTYGEVISASSDTSGFHAAEDLIAAIYHRFVIFEPMFKEAGTGAAVSAGGTSYFTANFAASGLDSGLAAGEVVVYPFADQQGVDRNFLSDREAPDPVPDRNEVGYPISVHANILSTLTVESFTVRPRGGNPLNARLLSHANDVHTGKSVAALIPLAPLTAGTVYDVQFTGKLDGADLSRHWSFVTR